LAPEPAATLRGALVVHSQDDLRLALDQVRAAQQDAGRDALALRVLRRSAEHMGTVLGWDQLDAVESLVSQFAEGFSDRWTYQLRAALPSLAATDPDALARFEAELRRLLAREAAPTGSQVVQLLAGYRRWAQESRNWPLPRVLDGFVTLCQSAFLARGRE